MKKKLLSAVLLSTLGLSTVNAATVGSSVDVSAVVEKVCYFRTLRDVHFNYDATVKQDSVQMIDSESMFYIQCTTGLNSQLKISGISNENRILTSVDGDTLRYKLSFQDMAGNDLVAQPDDTLTHQFGESVLVGGNSFMFNFVIPHGQFVKAHNYSETLTLTVSY